MCNQLGSSRHHFRSTVDCKRSYTPTNDYDYDDDEAPADRLPKCQVTSFGHYTLEKPPRSFTHSLHSSHPWSLTHSLIEWMRERRDKSSTVLGFVRTRINVRRVWARGERQGANFALYPTTTTNCSCCCC